MQSILAFLGLIAVFIIAAVWLGIVNERRETQRLRKHFLGAFGTVPKKQVSLERQRSIPAYYRRHSCDRSIDDITWNDLDLDAVYQRLDSTRSAAGEEYLYYVLRTPAWSAADRNISEDAADWLGDEANQEPRIQLELLLHDLGHTGKYSLLDYLDQLDQLGSRSSRKDYVSLLLPLVCIGIMVLQPAAGVVLLIAALIWNMLSYLSQKREIEPYLVSFRYLLRLLKVDEKMAQVSCEGCPSLTQDLVQLQTELRKFDGFRRGSFMLMSGSGTGNPLDIVMDYVRMLFHLDLIKFNQMLEQVRRQRGDLDVLLAVTGRIDAEIAVASFRKSLPYWCRMEDINAGAAGSAAAMGRTGPAMALDTNRGDDSSATSFHIRKKGDSDRRIHDSGGRIHDPDERIHDSDEKTHDSDGRLYDSRAKDDGLRQKDRTIFLQADALYHPLLSHPVPNSICAVRPVLLTGSNASGKSTFLKAVALAALLGQTINTVCAKQYRGNYFRLYSSMALRDNLRGGESYFMVEIKSLKRIMDAEKEAAGSSNPVLCFIDEVLRGTNTIERIAASSEILEDFAESGVLCFAATHDIELSDLLAPYYDNYHFEETLQSAVTENEARADSNALLKDQMHSDAAGSGLKTGTAGTGMMHKDSGKQDVVFSYRLHSGKATSRNAIRLLSAVGFDGSITDRAEKRARQFEETGRWR